MTEPESTPMLIPDAEQTKPAPARKTRRWWIFPVVLVIVLALLAGGAVIGVPLLEKQAIEKAEAALQAEQPDEAIAAVEAVLKYRQSGLLKQIPQLIALRGRAHFAQNDFDSALTDFEEALQLDPQQIEIHEYRTQIYLERGELEQAADEALLADPESGLSESLKALLAYEANDYPTAAAMAEAALTKTEPLPEAYLVQGALQTWREEYAEGLVNLSRALELDPQNAQALAYRAFIHVQLQDWTAAQADAQRLSDDFPQSPFTLWIQGILLENYQHQTDQGLEQIKAALDQEERPEFFYSRANMESQWNPSACQADMDKALSLNPDFFPVIALQNSIDFWNWELEDVDGALQQLRARSPNSLSALKLEADFAERLFEYEKAEALHQQMETTYPTLLTECALGNLYFNQNYLDRAEEQADLLLQKWPESFCGLSLNNQIAIFRNDEKTAHQYADQMLAIHPTEVHALKFKTITYLIGAPSATEIKEARALIEQIRQLAPEWNDLYWLEHYLATAEEENAQILSTASVLVQREPGNPYALLARSDGYWATDNDTRSLSDLEAALRLQERLPNAYGRRVSHYINEEKFDLATRDCQRMLEINPRDENAYANLGLIALYKKEYQTSIEQETKALELNPYALMPLLVLSDAQIKTGQLDKAMTTLETILEREEELSAEELTHIEQQYNTIKKLPPLVDGKRTQKIGTYNISIAYPNNWMPVDLPNFDLVLYPYMDDAEVDISFQIIDNPFPGAVTPQILIDVWAKMHQQEGLKMERLEKGPLSNSTESCQTYTSRHEVFGDGKKIFIYSRAYMFASEDTLIIAEVTAPDKETLDQYLTEVDEIMRSLTFLTQ